MDITKIFEKFDHEQAFVKTTQPAGKLTSAQKSVLNRKGNVLFNEGDIEAAKRIFLTTGYSDGIARIGDAYKAQGRQIDALKMYWQAPDKAKAEPLIKSLAELFRGIISEQQEENTEDEWRR